MGETLPKLLPRSDVGILGIDPFPGVERGAHGRILVRGVTIDPATAKGTLMRLAADTVKLHHPEWTRNARQLAIANGWFESFLGGAGSFAPGGVPSWNWGAVMARPGQDFIPHGDHKANGEAFTGHYAKFPTMADGFLFWVKIMPKQAIVAMQSGNAYEQARVMFKAGYYSNVDPAPLGDPEGDRRRIQGYANALVRTARQVAAELGEPQNLVTGAEGSHGYLAPTDNDLAHAAPFGSTGPSGSGPTGAGVAVLAGLGVTGVVLAGQAIAGKGKA